MPMSEFCHQVHPLPAVNTKNVVLAPDPRSVTLLAVMQIPLLKVKVPDCNSK